MHVCRSSGNSSECHSNGIEARVLCEYRVPSASSVDAINHLLMTNSVVCGEMTDGDGAGVGVDV